MPRFASRSRIASRSSIRSPRSGIVTIAILPPSADGLEEKLQNLDVTLGFLERHPPGIQAVSAYQERMCARLTGQQVLDFGRQPVDVLIVVHDGNPLPVVVAGDA